MSCNTIKENKSKRENKRENKSKKNIGNILSGGKFLGEGAYGCVISPALQCDNGRRKTIKNSKSGKRSKSKVIEEEFGDNREVSKIISRLDDRIDAIENEIDISSKLKNIDPHQKYFLYIKNYCRIRDVPKDRSNLASVRFLDEESIEIEKLEEKILDKKHCNVDLKLQPINLILTDGGVALGDILNINSKIYSLSSKTKKLLYLDKYAEELQIFRIFYKYFKYNFRHLLEGIYKLHNHHIVHRDIKIENLMIDWANKSHSQVIVRFIDFGLSEILNQQYINSKYNIHVQGTPEFIPFEIYIASKIKTNYRKDKHIILKNVLEDLEDSKKYYKELQLDTSIIKPTVEKLIDNIYQSFTDGTMLSKYFGFGEINKFNGYVQKSDIYALGLTMLDIIQQCSGDSSCSKIKNNIKLEHLIKNMIHPDPDKRYNVMQCLKHPYFN